MRHLIVFIGVFGLLAIFGPSVNACQCARPGTPCESYGSAGAVFVGTVTGVRTENGSSKNKISWGPLIYKFAIEHSYSGVVGSETEVFTGRGGGDCGVPFRIGHRYLVYADRSENKLSTSICSRTTHYDRATEDLAFLSSLSSKPKGATIYGQIVRGTPRQKAVITLEDIFVKIEGEGVRREVRPDAEGRYRITGLPAGNFKISLQLPEVLTVDKPEREVTISDRGCASEDFYPEDNGRLTGRVIDAAGQPVARIMVMVLAPSADPRGSFISLERTDAEGRFSFSGIPAGNYLLGVNFTKNPETNDPTNAYAPTFYPGVADRSSAEVIKLGVGEKRSELDILVPVRNPLSVVSGRIVWDDGSPVTAAHLAVVDLTHGASGLRNGVDVDEHGQFTLNGYVGQKLRFEARSKRPHVQTPTNEAMETSPPFQITLKRLAETVTIVITKLR